MILTGCVTSSAKLPELPAMPADLPACFKRLVPEPKAGAMSKTDVYRLIAALRRSELEKAQCGSRALDFFDNLKAGLAQ